MLGSISAVMFFSLAIALVTSVNNYVSLFRNYGGHVQHPLIMPDQATTVSYNTRLLYYSNGIFFCMQMPCMN